MMADTPRHPLGVWLDRQKPKMAAYVFAEKHKISYYILYAHLRGAIKNPKMTTMRAIEKGTGGAVTVQAQMSWVEKYAHGAPRRPRKAAQPGAAEEPEDVEETEQPVPDEPEAPDQAVDDDADNGPLGTDVDDQDPKIVPF